MKKLEVSEAQRNALMELRKSLGIDLSREEMNSTVGGGCGANCMVTCAWHCESTCDASCVLSNSMGTGGKVCHVMPTDSQWWDNNGPPPMMA